MLEDFIEVNDLKARIIPLKKAVSTVREAEAALGVKASEIIKSLLFFDSGEEPLIAIVAGNKRVDTKKLCGAAKTQSVRLAEPKEVREVTGYEAGELPPVSVYGVRVFLDKELEEKELVYGGGGKKDCLLSIPVKEIIEFNEKIFIEEIS
ncbi:MAG: YbaK/EbsC family protein [Candidatus Diapherotrites archaeon]